MKLGIKLSYVVAGLAIIVIAAGTVLFLRKSGERENAMPSVEVTVTRGSVWSMITTTGTVEPQNRLEVKPPIGGRVDEILVREGDRVKKGQVIGWMSSIERAALLDAARARGEEELAYFQQVYKPAALITPMDGEVIVREIEPGQTINANIPVIVLSDRLIVKARVDETDIGKVKVGQAAEVTLDAYPDVKCRCRVDHISYESKLISNVTIYEVDLVPENMPEVFRSGMNANVVIIEESRENTLILPVEAVDRDEDGAFVLLNDVARQKPVRCRVTVGLADDQHVEIVQGLNEGQKVSMRKSDFSLSSVKEPAGSPFLPFGKKKKKK